MPDILHRLTVHAPVAEVYAAVSSAAGLEDWWTLASTGEPRQGTTYALDFGPAHHWQAVVTHAAPNEAFELELTRADADWTGTRVGFVLAENGGSTTLKFHHRGWAAANEHYVQSNTCWALYLRLMKRRVEHGERVAYAARLDA